VTGKYNDSSSCPVSLRMLEVYEVECFDPSKQPDIPSEAEIMLLKKRN